MRTLGEQLGEIKRMWIADAYRGRGLGSRLLDGLEEASRDLGIDTIRLDTNGVLTEAIALYRRAGYAAITPYNANPDATHFFEKSLT